jgi:fucose permease
VGTAVFTIGAAAMAVLGLALSTASLPLAIVALFAMGLPMAIADFLGNVEGTAVDKASPKSLLPAIHGTWGIGMLLGAGVSTIAIDAGWGLTEHYLVVAVVVAALSIWAAMQFPAHIEGDSKPKGSERAAALGVWREKRTLLIAVIGFSFVMAEISAGTWVPIALTLSGFSGAEAAAAFGLFWVVITIARLTGGFLVQAIGRFRTVLFSAFVTALGILIFMLVEIIALPYLGLVLWGWGMAMGFPMAVSTMGDDPTKSSHRINMIITVVYISSISVGPLLGSVGQLAGIYVAFGIPLVLMLVSALLSPVTKQSGRIGD